MGSNDEVVKYTRSIGLRAKKDPFMLNHPRFHLNEHLQRKMQEYSIKDLSDTCVNPLANHPLTPFDIQMRITLTF